MSNADTTEPATLTSEQAAKYLGCSVKTLLRLVAEGDLRHVRLSSRMIKFRPDDLDDYLDMQSRGGYPRRRR